MSLVDSLQFLPLPPVGAPKPLSRETQAGCEVGGATDAAILEALKLGFGVQDLGLGFGFTFGLEADPTA